MKLRLRPDSGLYQLIKPLAKRHGIPEHVVKDLIIDALSSIRTQVSETGRLQLRGVGVFKRKDIPARQRRNPKTGEPVTVPACSRIEFTEEGSNRPRTQTGDPAGESS